MADFKPFAATNEPDTCLWCGGKLRHRSITEDVRTEDARGFHTRPVVVGHQEKGGDYADGFFCTMRCAYQFAVALAGHGHRLEPKK